MDIFYRTLAQTTYINQTSKDEQHDFWETIYLVSWNTSTSTLDFPTPFNANHKLTFHLFLILYVLKRIGVLPHPPLPSTACHLQQKYPPKGTIFCLPAPPPPAGLLPSRPYPSVLTVSSSRLILSFRPHPVPFSPPPPPLLPCRNSSIKLLRSALNQGN